MEVSLAEITKHPFVRELIEQNEEMAEALPETLSKKFSSSRKKLSGTLMEQIQNSEPPYTIPDRLIFQEGIHNSLFYSYEDIKDNFRQWENLSLFLAEHEDGSPAWKGVTKNIKLVDDEKAIYGDIETPDKEFALKLAYNVDNKLGKMGISPTLDVDKQLSEDGETELASSPWKVHSQSIVLNPAVRTTVFNSERGANMETKSVQLKKDEVVISKEDLDELKNQSKELQDLRKEQTANEVEELAALEIILGRTKEDKIEDRKEVLSKLSSQERKVLMETYGWLSEELTFKDPDEMWLEHLEKASEDLKGKIPPGLQKYIEEQRKKKKEKMAKKKGDVDRDEDDEEDMNEEEMAHPDKKKKYPYPYPEADKGHMSEETLSEKLHEPRRKKSSLQELSEKSKKENMEFIQFLQRNQGTRGRA